MEELLAFGQGGGKAAADHLEPGALRDLFEHREPFPISLVDQEAIIQPQQVKQVQADGLVGAQSLDFPDAPEPAHQLLKRQGIALLIHRQHLAVEDEIASGEARLHRLDDFRQARRNLIEPPGENSDPAADSVDLDAGAVELMLERNVRPENREGVGDSVGGLRQHRLERPYRQRRSGSGRIRDGIATQGTQNPARVALHHVDAPHFRNRPSGGIGDRLQHHPLAHAMAHLADQNLGQILGLQRGCTNQQAAQHVELALACLPPFDCGDLAQLTLDLRNRQRGSGLVGTQAHHNLDRIAEINRLGEDILAAIQRFGDFRGHSPNGASADVELGFVADRKGAANHEAGGGLGLFQVKRGQKIAGQFRHLEAALGLAQGLTHLGELIEAGHVGILYREHTRVTVSLAVAAARQTFQK